MNRASTPEHDPKALPWPQIPLGNKDHTNAAVVIIGAGFGGMCQAINLLKEGIRNFVIIEKSGGFGGTWRDNKFPGAACDVFSHLYSFSFERNTNWSRIYAGQEEILDYLVEIASKYRLYKYARFNTEVLSAKWSDKRMKWETTVRLSDCQDAEYCSEYVIASDYLVSAVGQLSKPKFPQITGISDFQGKLMHSTRWDWNYNLEGKRVAIIGTGATSGQIVPEVAKVAGHLTVFQRSPTFIFPRHDHEVSFWLRKVLRYVPGAYRQFRGGLMNTRESFHRILTNKDGFQETAAGLAAKKMRAELPDRPDLWEKLQPTFKAGCKRPIITDTYFPTFLRNNVSLETGPIHSITKRGILLKEDVTSELPFDIIICATGFDTLGMLAPMNIETRDGESLRNTVWRKHSSFALRGISASKCPNFAMLFGPNSGSSHNSMVLTLEAQSRVITRMIMAVMNARKSGQTLAFTPNPSAMDRWNEREQMLLKQTSYLDPTCTSWWRNEEGKVTNQYHGTAIEYQKEMSYVHWSDYDVFGTGSGPYTERKNQYIGRVVEETIVSNKTLALSILVALVAVLYLSLLTLQRFGGSL